jgi:hypothetical protein
MITMYDSIDISQIPADAPCVLGYVDGRWPTAGSLGAKFPMARLITLTVLGGNAVADGCDIETGDLTPQQGAEWIARRIAAGQHRPVAYASAGNMGAVLDELAAAGVQRSQLRLLSAHYGIGPHICGPSSCHLMSIEADGTQWTSSALGRDLDESVLADDFFGATPPVPHPGLVPAWQEVIMQALPLVRQGDSGPFVRTVQALCVARGHATVIDGAFGPATAVAVAGVQRSHGLAADSVVGPLTWAALAGV